MAESLVLSKVKGMDELRKALSKITARAQLEASVTLTKTAAQTIARAARKKCPVVSGTLKKSIIVRQVSKKSKKYITYHVGHKMSGKNNGWYGRLVEFGTLAHEIPKKSNAEKYNNATMLINGSFIGGTVQHPGAEKKPYMRPAFDEYWQKGLAAGAKRAKKVIEKPLTQR